MLKYKALLYRYTGVYLAEQEEAQYMRSKAALREINELSLALYDQRLAYNIVLGMWQSKNGFMRPISRLRLRNNNKTINALATMHETFMALRKDIKKLLWKLKTKV